MSVPDCDQKEGKKMMRACPHAPAMKVNKVSSLWGTYQRHGNGLLHGQGTASFGLAIVQSNTTQSLRRALAPLRLRGQRQGRLQRLGRGLFQKFTVRGMGVQPFEQKTSVQRTSIQTRLGGSVH